MISKKKKKKKVFTKIETDISSNFANSDVWGGAVFEWGGLFSIFHLKSASKAQKTCDFAYFTSQLGGLGPPRPSPGYATGCNPPPSPLATLLVTAGTFLEHRPVLTYKKMHPFSKSKNELQQLPSDNIATYFIMIMSVRCKFMRVRSLWKLCARAHAHSLEEHWPTLPAFELELTHEKVKPSIAILIVGLSLIFVSVNAIMWG